MRNNALVLATIASLSWLTAGCGDDQAPGEAAALWDRVQSESYRSFARAPGFEMRQPSDTAHDDNVDIYVNDVVSMALTAAPGATEWPIGSLIVKDGFDDDGALQLVAILDKRDTGWFWAEYNEDGESLFSGQPSLCIDCHSVGSDSVRAFALP